MSPLTSHTEQGHLWQRRERPRLSSAESVVIYTAGPAARLLLTANTVSSLKSAVVNCRDDALNSAQERSQHRFGSAPPPHPHPPSAWMLLFRRDSAHGSEFLAPLFFLLCIASTLLRSTCALRHLVSAAAAPPARGQLRRAALTSQPRARETGRDW